MRALVYLLVEQSAYNGVESALILLLFILSFCIYVRQDSLTSVASFIVLIRVVIFILRKWFSFWMFYLLFLLFLRGLLVVLVFIRIMVPPTWVLKNGFFFVLPFFLYSFGIQRINYVSLNIYYRNYSTFYYFLIGFILFIFLVSCSLFFFRKSALRLL